QFRLAALHPAVAAAGMAALRACGLASDRSVCADAVPLQLEIPVVAAARSLRAACVRPPARLDARRAARARRLIAYVRRTRPPNRSADDRAARGDGGFFECHAGHRARRLP